MKSKITAIDITDLFDELGDNNEVDKLVTEIVARVVAKKGLPKDEDATEKDINQYLFLSTLSIFADLCNDLHNLSHKSIQELWNKYLDQLEKGYKQGFRISSLPDNLKETWDNRAENIIDWLSDFELEKTDSMIDMVKPWIELLYKLVSAIGK